MTTAIADRIKQMGGADVPAIHQWFPEATRDDINEAILEVWRQDRDGIALDAVSDTSDFTPEELALMPRNGNHRLGYLAPKGSREHFRGPGDYPDRNARRYAADDQQLLADLGLPELDPADPEVSRRVIDFLDGLGIEGDEAQELMEELKRPDAA